MGEGTMARKELWASCVWSPQWDSYVVARVHSQWGVNPLGVARVAEVVRVRACGTLWPGGSSMCVRQSECKRLDGNWSHALPPPRHDPNQARSCAPRGSH